MGVWDSEVKPRPAQEHLKLTDSPGEVAFMKIKKNRIAVFNQLEKLQIYIINRKNPSLLKTISDVDIRAEPELSDI